MATNVIMPALGMAQETGMLVRWLKSEGAQIARGEAIAEIMTDKAMVELEAPADGVLTAISAAEGESVPVGTVIARVLAPGEQSEGKPGDERGKAAVTSGVLNAISADSGARQHSDTVSQHPSPATLSPLASRIAAAHDLDPAGIPAAGRRIQKADVLSYLDGQRGASSAKVHESARLVAASPKARRVARELGADISAIAGTGPHGAVLTRDVLSRVDTPDTGASVANGASASPITSIWRIMAERTTQSWTQVPHFFLVRDVNASRLLAWREQAQRHSEERITYTDLLVKVVAATLRAHPFVNASWSHGTITRHSAINIGLAVAVEDGLVVPVIHQADQLSLAQIARSRIALVERAQSGKLRPDDVSGGTFTISNLGMYGVDAFNAIINAPQGAILAVGRIADRVVPLHGVPAVQPMVALSLSCDHRVVDGARGARFLGALADLIEEPLALLE